TDMGVCLNLSGQGCRTFEEHSTVGWISLFEMISKYHGNVTRLDLAYDDHMGVIDIHRFVYDIREQNYRSKSKKHEIVESMDQNTGILGISVYIGRKESDVMIRVYDKAAERGYTDRHWIRIELQLRHDRAAAALDQLLQRESIGVLSAGVLRNYLTVCVPTSDSNKSRWPIAYYWERVLGQIETIRLWATPGEPYNFYKTEDHLIKQYCQFLLAFTEMHGTIHDLLLMARQYHGKKDLKPKYKNAIIEHFSRIRKSGSSLPPMSDGCNSAVAYFSNEIFNLLYDDDVNFPF
ncbi:MAG: replication initiation factor domain-containing protein, partial [Oscillospiraceae bacterium]|nr:replication initiation factor domain-containing protein [Oscillospiraceae bacterium]